MPAVTKHNLGVGERRPGVLRTGEMMAQIKGKEKKERNEKRKEAIISSLSITTTKKCRSTQVETGTTIYHI